MLLGVDAGGYVGLTFGSRESDGGRSVELVEQRIREYLHLPGAGAEPNGGLDRRPKAPAFEGRGLGGGEDFRLQDHTGKPLVLVFFLHTCPHCQEALRFFKSALAKIPEKQRPQLIGVSSEHNSYAVSSTPERGGLGLLSDSGRSRPQNSQRLRGFFRDTGYLSPRLAAPNRPPRERLERRSSADLGAHGTCEDRKNAGAHVTEPRGV